MAIDQIQEISGYPVNAAGEIVVRPGGSNDLVAVGVLPSGMLPVDITSGGIAFAGIGGSQATIAGTYRVGQTLTAVPSAGWSFTAGQWKRDGVVISGQTGLTYVQVTADIGKTISFTPTSPVFSAIGSSPTTVAGVTVPGAPTIGTLVAGDSKATANWTAPTDNGGSVITGYKVTASNGNIVTAAANATSVDVPGTNGSAFTVVVQALNSIGYGPVSATSNSATPSAAVELPFARKTLGLSAPFVELMPGVLTSNSSWRIVRTAPRAFTRIRCILYNRDTANPAVGIKAAWSPSESVANGARPTIGGVVSDASQTIFTFGGVGSVTLPVAPAANVPSVTVSDWMNTPSVARTDGETDYPLIYTTQFFTNTAQLGYSRPGNSGTTFRAFLEGLSGMRHKFRVYTQNVDAVANPGSFTAPQADTQFCIPMGIEVDYGIGTRSILSFGDSTMQGAGNTANAGAPLMALAQFDAAGNLADTYAGAHQGMMASVMYTRALDILAIHKPDVLYFQPFSVNDTSNYAGSSAATKTRVDNLITYCAANSINLILETPQPIVIAGGTAVSGAELTALADMTTYILSKASNRVKVMDLTALHSAPNSGVWSATYGFDNYHPNPAGHTFKTSALVTAVNAL